MNEFDPLVPAHRVRTMQLLAAALMFGIVAFFGVALATGNKPAVQETPTLSLLAAAFLFLMAPASFLIPIVVEQQAVRQIATGTFRPPPGSGYSTVGQLLWVRQTSLLIGLALLEGTAFLSLVGYMAEGKPFVLAITILTLALMAVRFPTQTSVTTWVEQQMDHIEELIDQAEADDD